jgi:hypothetical protein
LEIRQGSACDGLGGNMHDEIDDDSFPRRIGVRVVAKCYIREVDDDNITSRWRFLEWPEWSCMMQI